MVLIQFVAGIGHFQAWNSPKSAKHGYAKFASRRQGSPPHLQTVPPAPGVESRNFEVANTLNCRAPGSSRVSCEHCISFSGDFIEDTTVCYWPGMSRPSYQAIIAHFRLFQRIRVWYNCMSVSHSFWRASSHLLEGSWPPKRYSLRVSTRTTHWSVRSERIFGSRECQQPSQDGVDGSNEILSNLKFVGPKFGALA